MRFVILILVLLLPSVAGAAEMVVVKAWETTCRVDQKEQRTCAVEMFGVRKSTPMTGLAVIVEFKPEPYLTVLVVRGGLYRRVDVRVDGSKAKELWFCKSTICGLRTQSSSDFVAEMMAGESLWIRAYNEGSVVAVDMQISLMGFAEAVTKTKMQKMK